MNQFAMLAASLTMISAMPAAATTAPIAPPARGAYLGAYVNLDRTRPPRAAFVGMTERLETAMRAKRPGAALALHLHFFGWKMLADVAGDPSVTDDLAKGRTPVLTWTCGAPLEAIASGADDAQIVASAHAVAALHGRVMLRWFHEFNLNLKNRRANGQNPGCFGENPPSEFIAAWRHIHDVFAAAGATNVTWVWCPAAGPLNLRETDVMSFFPGKKYVDWVGGDFYSHGRRSFTEVATPFYDLIHRQLPSMPILIGETGQEANARPPFTQEAYLAEIESVLPTRFPQIKALIYFDGPGNRPNDFRLTPNGLAAFAKLAANPYFSARP